MSIFLDEDTSGNNRHKLWDKSRNKVYPGSDWADSFDPLEPEREEEGNLDFVSTVSTYLGRELGEDATQLTYSVCLCS